MQSIPEDDPRAAALIEAIRKGREEEIGPRLEQLPDARVLRLIDAHGVLRTPLHVAADWPGHRPGGAAVVRALAGAGVDLDAGVVIPDRPGVRETALHWAASSGDLLVLDALLDVGADIEAIGDDETRITALGSAVIFAQWTAAQRLLERGASCRPWQAAALGLLDRVREWTDGHPAPSSRDLTNAAWNACRAGKLEVARHLAARGANLDWIGHGRRSVLDVARESGSKELVAWLEARLEGGGASRARPDSHPE